MSDSHPILANNNSSMSMDFCMGDSYLVEGDDCSNQEMSNSNEEPGGNQTVAALPENDFRAKREPEMPASELPLEDKSSNPPQISKKRSRNLGDVSTITSIYLLRICYICTGWSSIFCCRAYRKGFGFQGTVLF
jgi:hypothetical protein